MKKIISGKSYDTTTARYVGGISAGNGDRLYGWSESLYVKRTGEYFLHGEGGPGSQYSRQTGFNNWSGSEEIRPLPYAEARAWAEKHLDAAKFEAEFGVVDEDDSRTVLSVSVSTAAADKARRAAAEAGLSLSAYIESALAERL